MDYAKTNLRTVQDAAAEHGLSEFQEARFPQRDLGAEQTGINFLTVKPGQREAFAQGVTVGLFEAVALVAG